MANGSVMRTCPQRHSNVDEERVVRDVLSRTDTPPKTARTWSASFVSDGQGAVSPLVSKNLAGLKCAASAP